MIVSPAVNEPTIIGMAPIAPTTVPAVVPMAVNKNTDDFKTQISITPPLLYIKY
jgi:hypothetical protein